METQLPPDIAPSPRSNLSTSRRTSFWRGGEEQQEPGIGLGSRDIYALTVNFLLGAGVLGVPHAFSVAGAGLASVGVIVVSALSLLTASWIPEVVDRGCALTALGVTDPRELLREEGRCPSSPNWGHHGEPMQMAELSRRILGHSAGFFWGLCILALHFVAQWLCAAIWCSSMLVAIPIPGLTSGLDCDVQHPPPGGIPSECQTGYYIFGLIFSAVALPLCCMRLEEQAKLQVFLTCAVIFTIAIMMSTLAACLWQHPYSSDASSGPPYIQNVQAFKWDGFGPLFMTLIFSQIFQQAIPGLYGGARNKQTFKRPIIAGVATTTTVYIVLGCLSVAYFGEDVESVITLNWRTYPYGEKGLSSAVSSLISKWVLLFPVLTTTAAFPLFDITLANNISSLLPSSLHQRYPNGTRIGTRLICAIFPIGSCMVANNASVIFSLCGMCGFFVEFIFPCLLQIRSEQLCNRLWGKNGARTPQMGYFSKMGYAVFTLILSVVMFLFGLYQVIAG